MFRSLFENLCGGQRAAESDDWQWFVFLTEESFQVISQQDLEYIKDSADQVEFYGTSMKLTFWNQNRYTLALMALLDSYNISITRVNRFIR